MPHEWIDVRGARVHNLKDVNVKLPRNQLVVVTGLSGSGKSSLAFDTIYAEGQRRYVESLSAYARQFLEQVEKPDVDQITGLSPAISIEQRTTGSNPRSTVGTVTEIYDYLRLLFASVGVPHCPSCGQEIKSQSVERMVETVMTDPIEERISVLAPMVRGRKGEFKKELAALRAKGFTKVRVDGSLFSLEEEVHLDRRKNHWIDVIIDRLLIRSGAERRLGESIDLALSLSDDVVIINTRNGGDRLFSRRLACVECGINVPEMTPRVFSFNSPHGACPDCQGLGVVEDFDPNRIVPDESLALIEGAIRPWTSGDRRLDKDAQYALGKLSARFDIDLKLPFRKLARRLRDLLMFGAAAGNRRKGQSSGLEVSKKGRQVDRFGKDFEGVIPNLRRRYEEGSWSTQEALELYRSVRPCCACGGERLRPESRAVKVNRLSIADYVKLPISEALNEFEQLTLTDRQILVADRVLREIRDRLRFLRNVGVGYLALGRAASTLSGGEAQRIRLATQIGSNLTGVLYVLDEPSIGLHQRDNQLLLSTLARLRDLGNTVVVVEHDEETIRMADYVVDLGLGAGEHGGNIVFQGTPGELRKKGEVSLTAAYLCGDRMIPLPQKRRVSRKGRLTIRGAKANNLKNIDVSVPIGLFTAVTGVSGSGKSTLVNDILYRVLARKLYRATDLPGHHKLIDGIDLIDKVIQIDQSPIGRTPRSNPATYTGLFTFIRNLYSMLPDARARGYRPGRFSFNVKGGRCEACQGDGLIAIEMHFLPDVYVTCEHCKGRRYNRETLEIKYRGVSIAEMLELTVDQVKPLLENFPLIESRLSMLQEVGLGYVAIGQSATTLSGGEAQRVKLAKELSKRSTGRTLYILDEPTTGLHLEDIRRLLDVLNLLVDQGNTVIVIEHHLDVIKTADYVVDLGPGGGDEGGAVVVQGTPEKVSKYEKSETGKYLKLCLQG